MQSNSLGLLGRRGTLPPGDGGPKGRIAPGPCPWSVGTGRRVITHCYL